MDVNARAAIVAIAILIVVANDHRCVGMVDAFGDAGPAVADLIANALGIGGLREHKPECCRDHAKEYFAKEYFAHGTLRAPSGCQFPAGSVGSAGSSIGAAFSCCIFAVEPRSLRCISPPWRSHCSAISAPWWRLWLPL